MFLGLLPNRYVENQELLTKNDNKIRDMQETIRMLTAQIEKMEMDSVCCCFGEKSYYSSLFQPDAVSPNKREAKRIKDLEKQVSN